MASGPITLVFKDQLFAAVSSIWVDCRQWNALNLVVQPPPGTVLLSTVAQSFTYTRKIDARVLVNNWPQEPWRVLRDPRARLNRIENDNGILDMPMPYSFAKVEILEAAGAPYNAGSGFNVWAMPYNSGGWSPTLPPIGPWDLFGNPITITGTGTQNIRLSQPSAIVVPDGYSTLLLELRLDSWSLASGTVDVFITTLDSTTNGYDAICHFAQLNSGNSAAQIYTATIRRHPGSGVTPHLRDEYGLSAGTTLDYWGEQLGASISLTSVPAGSTITFRIQATFLP